MAQFDQRKSSSGNQTVSPSRLAIFVVCTVLLVPLALRLSASRYVDWLRNASFDSLSKSNLPPIAQVPDEEVPKFAARPADVCHLVGFDSDTPFLWRYNSRMLCMASAVCVRSDAPFDAYLHSSNLNETKCFIDTPGLVPLRELGNNRADKPHACPDLQREKVLCAHGPGLHMNAPSCPQVKAWDEVDIENATATRWFEDITVLVPAYPYPGNIFHHGNALSWMSFAVESLSLLLDQWGAGNVHAPGGKASYFPDGNVRVRKVNLVFRSHKLGPGWQSSLLEVMLRHRLSTDGVNVTVHYLPASTDDTRHTCFRNVVVLGRRGHVNVWHFPNATRVPLDGSAVPLDAVNFKRAVYKAFDISARLPSRGGGGKMVSELPPLTVGYSRRIGAKEIGGSVHLGSSTRMFSDADEAWFTGMLREETEKAGVRLHTFTISSKESLEHQVKNIAQVGFLVGIHGANLVNSIFMHPFGGLLEILPHGATSQCYVAASNSGLAYYRYVSSEAASAEESGCTEQNVQCHKLARQKRVKIGSKKDRDGIRDLVRKGIEHLRYLHDMYPGGIFVRYVERTAYFDIPGGVKYPEGST